MIAQAFKNPRDAQYNGAALLYALVSYGLGWLLVLLNNLWLNLFGIVLLAHGMVIAAYLIHECAHKALMKNARLNEHVGKALNWLTGGCYGTFEDLRLKHIRHHVDNADVLAFDLQAFIRARPSLYRLLCTLERFYVPAVDLLMHGLQIIAPWVLPEKRNQRTHTLRVIVIRGGFFLLLLWVKPVALLCYAIAYLLFMHVLRFMDAFQHNYPVAVALENNDYQAPHRKDATYEFEHTFSNLISQRWPWLNLLVLNFCYHNAHHTRMHVPWYQLPELHRELYADSCPQVVPFREQLACYHCHRIKRVLGPNEEGDAFADKLRAGNAVGANGVSFLTAF